MTRFSIDPPEDDGYPPDDAPDEGEDLTPSERAIADELLALREAREAFEQQHGVDGEPGEDVPF